MSPDVVSKDDVLRELHSMKAQLQAELKNDLESLKKAMQKMREET